MRAVFVIVMAALIVATGCQEAGEMVPTPPPVSMIVPPVAEPADQASVEPAENPSEEVSVQPDYGDAGTEDNSGTEDMGEPTQTQEAEEPSPDSGIVEPQVPATGQYTPNDLIQHSTEDDCWLVVRGKVYDVTEFIPKHPGGKAILNGCGKDATAIFESKHGQNAKDKLPDYYIGEFLDME